MDAPGPEVRCGGPLLGGVAVHRFHMVADEIPPHILKGPELEYHRRHAVQNPGQPPALARQIVRQLPDALLALPCRFFRQPPFRDLPLQLLIRPRQLRAGLLLRLFGFLALLDHHIECRGQIADLVVARRRHRQARLAAGKPCRRPGELSAAARQSMSQCRAIAAPRLPLPPAPRSPPAASSPR